MSSSIKDKILEKMKEQKESLKQVEVEVPKQVIPTPQQGLPLNKLGFGLFKDDSNPLEVRYVLVEIAYNGLTGEAKITNKSAHIEKSHAIEQFKIQSAKHCLN